MVRLLAETFARRDPPAVALGLTVHAFEVFAGLYCAKAAAEGLTIVARSEETGEMAGALLAEDSTSEPPAGLEGIDEKFLPIFDALDQVEPAWRDAHAPGESLHLFLLGVAERFGGRGIGHELVARSVANGARRGYRIAVAEATNRTSQHIFRKQGFVERARLSYADYRYAGKAVFESIAGEGALIAVDRPLLRGALLREQAVLP